MEGTRVGALLLEADLIDSAQLERALEHQQHRGGRTLGILVELGMLEQDQMYRFLARRGLPAMNPVQCTIQKHVLGLLPREFVMQHEMLPVDRLGRLLTVAMVYPFDVGAIAQAEESTGLRVKPMLCRAKEFHEAARRLYPNDYDRCGVSPSSSMGEWTSVRQVPRGNPQLTKHTLDRIQQIRKLPMSKHTKGRFAMLDSASALNVERVSSILSRDPVALARVLSVANAREWTQRRPIIDRHEAIRSLGMSRVLEALESLGAWEEELQAADAVFTRWRSTAVRVAETASAIANDYAFVGATGVYEAALLHNLGDLALLMIDQSGFPDVYGLSPLERRHAREREVYGVTDFEAGAELAKSWGLPEPIVVTIRHLLSPESAPSSHDTVAVTALAHHIVQMERNLETDCTGALRILGLTPTTLRTTMLRLHARSQAEAVEI